VTGDPRAAEYARLLVGRSLAVQPGWQVLVTGTVQARPLLEELSRELGRIGAFPLRRLTWGPPLAFDLEWLAAAPEELATQVAPLERQVLDGIDAAIFVLAPERHDQLAGTNPKTLAAQSSAYRARGRAGEVPTVLCDYPCAAFAELAGLPLEELERTMFDACLRDWDAEAARMEPLRARLGAAREVRLDGEDTELTLSVDGRPALVDDGHLNMPGGEIFCCPVEGTAEGRIRFADFPQFAYGVDVADIRLTFREGRVVEAAAAEGEDVLLRALDTDEGARGVGELGIGCNPAITRYTRNLLYDEKIDGTVHLAIGAGLPIAGGLNRSSVHWDLVRSMRGSTLSLDGEVVLEDGRWLLA
jgi:aminopeptidase